MQKTKNWVNSNMRFHSGCWFGGILCFVGLLSLSLGLVSLIKSLRWNRVIVKLPEKNALNLKLPGAYLALGVIEGLSSEDVRRVQELEYLLTDKDGKEVRVVKIPAKRYAVDGRESQAPLFEFVVEKAGTYFLESAYPFGLEGPEFHAFLLHMDVNYVRTELITGVVLFLLFGGLGFYVIRKTVQAQNLPAMTKSVPHKSIR